jgi:hypothetical protein
MLPLVSDPRSDPESRASAGVVAVWTIATAPRRAGCRLAPGMRPDSLTGSKW